MPLITAKGCYFSFSKKSASFVEKTRDGRKTIRHYENQTVNPIKKERVVESKNR